MQAAAVFAQSCTAVSPALHSLCWTAWALTSQRPGWEGGPRQWRATTRVASCGWGTELQQLWQQQCGVALHQGRAKL